MARVSHRDFSAGLWLTGPRDVLPARALRRATGISSFGRTGKAIRSRWGHQLFAAALGTVADIVRFAGNRYVHWGNDFGLVSGGAAATLLGGRVLATGARLRFASAIPTTATSEAAFPNGPQHLFVCGTKNFNGGSTEQGSTFPFKLSTSNEWSPWGIAKPNDSYITSVGVDLPLTNSINNFESSPVAIVDSTLAGNMSFVSSSVNKQFGSSAHGFTIAEDALGAFGFLPVSGNFLTYLKNNVQHISPPEDCIRMWVFVDKPENLDYIDLTFDVTDGAVPGSNYGSSEGLNDTFSYKIFVEDLAESSDGVTGTADDARIEEFRFVNNRWNYKDQVQTGQREASVDNEPTQTLGDLLSLSNAAKEQILNDLAQTKISSKTATWTHLRIPKRLFTRSGKAVVSEAVTSTDRTWAQIRRVRIAIKSNSNGAVSVLFDRLDMHYGTGMFGDYRYAFTYKNSKTGSRSNPSKIYDVKGVIRQSVSIVSAALLPGNLPPGVDRVEVWRTLGNGKQLFKADEFDPSTQTGTDSGTYSDSTADYDGIQSRINPTGSYNSKYLQDEALPFDNEPPDSLTSDVAGPYLGSLWTITQKRGKRGRLYYSPPGRPESIGGYIIVTGDDDPLQRVIYWNGMFVWSKQGVFAIDGTNPFIARKIHGVPGTNDPSSVVPTPEGVLYRADDGVRRFSGTSSDLVSPDAMLPIFNEESVSTIVSTFGSTLCAAYHKEEYVIGDGTTTYAVNLRTGVWRNVGSAFRALFAESDTGQLVGGIGSSLYLFERVGQLMDNTTAIPFDIEVPGVVVEDQSSITKLVQRVYFDANTNSQALTITLVRTGSLGTEALGTLNTSQRSMVEFAVLSPADIASIRITGSLTNEVEIAGVYYDLHLPEEGGSLT